jgi:hypothetical protein
MLNLSLKLLKGNVALEFISIIFDINKIFMYYKYHYLI